MIDLLLERERSLLTQGAILVDEQDFGEDIRALVYLEHSIKDARQDRTGLRRTVSQRMQYVEILSDGSVQNAGYAPYLNYRPLLPDELALSEKLLQETKLGEGLETSAKRYAIEKLVPSHLAEVRQQKEPLINKTMRAVQERLAKEIHYWDGQVDKLRQQEKQGKTNAKINSDRAQQRLNDLQVRLSQRLEELQQEIQLSPGSPLVVGGALIVPIGLIDRIQGKSANPATLFARETKRVEMAGMNAVMNAERALGNVPEDVSREKCGYDILSRTPDREGQPSQLRFIEVKGRIEGAESVVVTKNEILTALNQPERYILAIVQVPFEEGGRCDVRYVWNPFEREPDWQASAVIYPWKQLWKQGSEPI